MQSTHRYLQIGDHKVGHKIAGSLKKMPGTIQKNYDQSMHGLTFCQSIPKLSNSLKKAFWLGTSSAIKVPIDPHRPGESGSLGFLLKLKIKCFEKSSFFANPVRRSSLLGGRKKYVS